ncbi:hypothetical protein GCM10023116_20250 [Kistimonas scapharcae]|uniref:Uncharacterized protein n=1 Tax=Kistimonas scapharcae TaxID=1036133 RepID=A0ABP8V3V6_9GAMM
MRFTNDVSLGQVIQALSPILTGAAIMLYASAYFLGDVENTKKDVVENREAIAKEELERKREDERLEAAFKSRTGEVKQQIKDLEERIRIPLKDMQDDIKFLVREKIKNGSKTSSD